MDSFISKKKLYEICPKEVVIFLKKISLSEETKSCNDPKTKSYSQREVYLCTNKNSMRELNSKNNKSKLEENYVKIDESKLNQDLSLNSDGERNKFPSGERPFSQGVCEEISIKKIKEEFPDMYIGNEMKLITGLEQTVDVASKLLPQDCIPSLKEEEFGEISMKEEMSPSCFAHFHGEKDASKSENSRPDSPSELLQQDLHQEKVKCSSTNNQEVPLRFTRISLSPSNCLTEDKRWPTVAYSQTEADRRPTESSNSSFLSQSTTVKSLAQHLGVDNKKKKFKCSYCLYETSWKGHIVTHIRTHTGEKPFMCNLCPFQVARKEDLKRHLRTHTGEKPFKCNYCPYQSAQKVNFQRHLKTHTFKCSYCTYHTGRKKHIEAHLRTHTGEKAYKCSSCPYQSANKRRLDEHLRTHTSEKPFQCNFCPYQSERKQNLHRHERIHTGEKPYSFSLGPFQTTHSGSLQRHERTHLNETEEQLGDDST